MSDQLLFYQIIVSHGFGYVELHCEMQILLDKKTQLCLDTVVNFTPIVEVNFEWDVAVVNGSSNTKHASQDSVMSASSSSFVMFSNLGLKQNLLYVILQCVLWHIELCCSFPLSNIVAAG